MFADFPPAVQAVVRRILDSAARRLLDERAEETDKNYPAVSTRSQT